MNKNKFKLDLFGFWTLSIALYWKEKKFRDSTVFDLRWNFMEASNQQNLQDIPILNHCTTLVN